MLYCLSVSGTSGRLRQRGSLTVQSNRGVSEVSSTTLKGALINKYGIKNYGDGYKYQKGTF